MVNQAELRCKRLDCTTRLRVAAPLSRLEDFELLSGILNRFDDHFLLSKLLFVLDEECLLMANDVRIKRLSCLIDPRRNGKVEIAAHHGEIFQLLMLRL